MKLEINNQNLAVQLSGQGGELGPVGRDVGGDAPGWGWGQSSKGNNHEFVMVLLQSWSFVTIYT